MSVIFLLIPLAFLVAGAAIFAFIWSARHGQFDDLDTPPLRIIFDDDDDALPSDEPRTEDKEATRSGS